MWKESLFSLERYGRSRHLFQRNVAENYRCRVILSASNYKWQCLSFSSWKPNFTPSVFLSWRSVKVYLPRSSFVSNLLWMVRNSHQLDCDNVSFRGNEKVSTALAFIQMFFSSCTPGKYMCINNVCSKIPQHWNLFWNMLLSFTFSVGRKWKLCFVQ